MNNPEIIDFVSQLFFNVKGFLFNGFFIAYSTVRILVRSRHMRWLVILFHQIDIVLKGFKAFVYVTKSI